MRTFPRVRDLVADVSWNYSINAKLTPFTPPDTPQSEWRWQQEDGAPFDPWLRVHWRSGGEFLKVAHPSMLIEESLDDWEEWTGMKFPESGDYVIPDALVPVQIDRQMNVGRYVEPNVWVHHPIATQRLLEQQIP